MVPGTSSLPGLPTAFRQELALSCRPGARPAPRLYGSRPVRFKPYAYLGSHWFEWISSGRAFRL